MLAISTGWTESVLDRMSVRFRAACHWLLYARAICGESGLPVVEIPKGGSPEQKRAALEAMGRIDEIRSVLYPEGD